MRSDNCNILEFLHPLSMHEDAASAVHTRPTSWRGNIEVAFHYSRFQSTRLKDSWKTMYCSFPPLLEGKQFKRGGFVTSPLH